MTDIERAVDNAIYTIWHRVSSLRLFGEWPDRKRQVLDIIEEERAKQREYARDYAAVSPADEPMTVTVDLEGTPTLVGWEKQP